MLTPKPSLGGHNTTTTQLNGGEILTSIRLFGLLALLCAAVPAVGQADEVTVRGSSMGWVAASPELSFEGTDFGATTTKGVGSFSETNSLGTFSLAAGSLPPRPRTAYLRLQLVGADGAQPVTRTLRAVVTPNAQGGVSIHFTTPEAKVRFDNGKVIGSFAVRAADFSLEAGQSAPVAAALSGSQEADTPCHLTFTSARANPSILSDANQQMVPVTITPAASDQAGCGLTCKIDSVSMNDAPASGSDYQITGDLTLQLRADRLNDGNGRLYSVAVRCTDQAGNSITQKVPVAAPLKRGR